MSEQPIEPMQPLVIGGQLPPGIDPSVLLMVQGLGPVVPRKRTLVSCHFRPLRERFMHSGRREFFIPACKRGEYRHLRVYDSQQECQDTRDPQMPPNRAGTMLLPVSVDTIVSNLLDNWGWMNTGQMSRVRLGVFEIKGDVATKDEEQHAQKFADASARALVEVADRIHLGLVDAKIDDLYRDALEYLGSENKPWYRGIEPGTMKRSVISGNRIPAAALVDQGMDIIEYYVKYELDPRDYEDHYVMARPELLKMARKRLGMSDPIPPPAAPPAHPGLKR